MTPEQKDLVQTSFEKVKPIADTAAELFYGRLFDLDPNLERLFKGDLEGQGRKLMHMIGLAVKGLNRPAELLPLLHELGARHAAYGVAEHDYDTVGAALLWTLQRGLGEAFTAEVGEAWTAVYELLSNSMKAGAKEALVVTTASPDNQAPTCTGGVRKSGREYFPAAGNQISKKRETEMQTEDNYETLTGRFASSIASIVMMIGFIFIFSAAARAETFHVTNTNDSGAGSLREAITESNLLAPATPNLIDFQILPAGGVKTISLLSALPDITSSVVIDGTTQPDYAGAPLIELDGSNAGDNTIGLNILAGNSTVKGLIINRFSAYGIALGFIGQNVIAGNYLGLDGTGTISLMIGGSNLHITTSGNLIGGTTPAERNVISGSPNLGIYFDGNDATGNLVKGNYIGTDASGTVGIGNHTGIAFFDAPGNTVGGTKLSERNIISGNTNGIWMNGSGSSNNVVLGNYIGTKADGTSNLANNYGVYISNGAHSNVIGGTSLGQANVIAFQYREVVLESSAGSGNVIRGNSFFSSGQMGIDLGQDGVTANDASDADSGANDLQNYPVITSAVANSGTVSITGTLNSVANKQFIIDLYSSPALSQQGNAEARKYLTSVATSTDGSGDAYFNVSVLVAKLTGTLISATATNDGNSTSELSLPAQVTGLNGVLEFSAPTYSVNENGAQATITVTRTNGSLGLVSVKYATSDGTAKQPGDYTSTSGTLSWPDGDTSSQSFNIPVIDDNLSEENETINLTLTSPVGGATLGGQSAAVLTIVDNEQPPNPADLVVTNTNDSGAGSLRQAILTANVLAGTDTISFNIQPAGVYTITPLSPLPDATDPVIIDATTQPGFAGAPVIELNGASAGQNGVSGLTIKGGSSTVKGFVINRFTNAGVLILSANNTVAGNFIGMDVTGNNRQAGNVFLGNYTGIVITSSNANNNVIGGTTAAARNVVSNNGLGIDICCGHHQSGNKVVGNYIGTNAGGDAALRNANIGIRVDTAPNTIVGGTTAAERNVISGNYIGIILADDIAGTLIQGNYIGTKADGTGALGNESAGIDITYRVTGVTVGGTGVGASNVIAFNGKGQAGEGGVSISYGQPFTPGKSVTVSQNAIFSNKGLGIDVGSNGVTANDAGDGDNGPNDLQNFPVLTSVMINGSDTIVQGTLNSEASKSYHVELFSNAVCSSSGFGQGQFFVDAKDVATDANGNGSFTFTIPTASITGTVFTATATNPDKSTSEFSVCASAAAAANPGTIQLGAGSTVVIENVGSLGVTVTRTGGTAGTVTVAYATTNGVGGIGATFPEDYTQTSGTLTFLDGETSKLITVPIIDDSVPEPQKSFSLRLSNPTGGATLGFQTGILITIVDDDKPTISINDVQVTEGNSGTTDAVFTVSLQRPYYTDAHVDFATLVTGTATSGTDYQPASGTLTFLTGETSKTITVKVNGDSFKEPNETFMVKLSNNVELGVTNGVGAGTIIDDDTQPGISINDVSQVEGNSGQTTFVFNATLSAASSDTITIGFGTAGGTATANDDYQTVSGTLTFNPGETSKTIGVAVNGDATFEPDETFFVQLSNPVNASIAKAQGTGTIKNDDASPSGSLNFSAASYSVKEDGGNATITVKRTGGSVGAVSVQYATSGGTAAANSDYTSTSGTLSWADGDNADKTFTIAIANDGVHELEETVNVTLSNPAGGASLGSASSAVLRITDDDAATPGSFNFTAASYSIDENGGTPTITVKRTGGTDGAVSVQYATSGGTAAANSDYTSTSGTLSWADGDSADKTFTIAIANDGVDELDETVNLGLSSPTGGASLGNPSSAVLTISDNDAPPAISISDVVQAEGNSGSTSFSFDVTLSAASSQSVTVDYLAADGTALVGGDYQAASGTLTFAPGETTKSFSVLVSGDTQDEPTETFVVNLSNPANATIAKSQGTGTIVNDDSAAGPSIEFSQAAYGVAEQLGALTVTVTRSGDAGSAASVDYATADGSAVQKSDFEYTAGTLNFNPGEVSKTFVVLLNQDSYSEGPESFNLVLSNPAGAALGAQSVSQVSITDDLPETVANPIDDAQTFVYLHYHDFLNREPDPAGLAFWTNQIASCGSDVQCLEEKRVNVSASFFLSIEFQETGYLRYLLEKESFGSTPRYAGFMRDVQEVSRGVIVNAPGWEQKLKDNQQLFAEKWIARPEFKAVYDGLSNDDYVIALYKNAGIPVPQAEQDKLVAALNAASMNRATVLLEVAADATFRQQEQNAAFVMMEYFGYLRRDPNAAPDSDLSGYNFWLNKLNQFGGNYIDAEMIKAFITSIEYRQRFAQ